MESWKERCVLQALLEGCSRENAVKKIKQKKICNFCPDAAFCGGREILYFVVGGTDKQTSCNPSCVPRDHRGNSSGVTKRIIQHTVKSLWNEVAHNSFKHFAALVVDHSAMIQY